MTFELGLNYWPRRRAMYMWRDLDLGEVNDDMAHIASMGFDVVRSGAAGAYAWPATVASVLDVSADEYYRAPAQHFARLYASWLSRTPV